MNVNQLEFDCICKLNLRVVFIHFSAFWYKTSKSISNPQDPHYFLSPLLHKTIWKQPPCHSCPNLQYGIVRQPDISIHIDQFSLFHAVIGASSHVAVLNHFIVCNAQYSESSYQKIAPSCRPAFGGFNCVVCLHSMLSRVKNVKSWAILYSLASTVFLLVSFGRPTFDAQT